MPVKMLRKLQYVIVRLLTRQRMSQGLSNVKKLLLQTISRNKNNEYTKMVKAIGKRRKSVLENDPIRQRMLKERQEHARRQEHDYSHVFRKKTRLELIRLSLIITGIEFAYSAETAFVSPILLSIGIEHKHMTMVWALSPLLGFFLSPILGSISDRCSSRFGRRRPLIVVLSIGLILGLILAPYGRDIGKFLGDGGGITFANLTDDDPMSFAYKTVNVNKYSNGFFYAILFTVLGTLLLDFNADNCQTPSRAYLLDLCVPEEQAHALSTFTLMSGVGGCMGYALGAINWDQTVFANFIGDNIKTVFTLVTVIFICAMLVTITSFREIPLKLMDSDELLKPVTQVAVKKEKDRLKSLNESNSNGTSSKAVVEAETSEPTVSFEMPKNYGSSSQHDSSSLSVGSSDDEDDEDDHITLMMYLKSIVFMPKSLRILCFTNCLSWMGHILYCLYFTDFVGETVFGGNPAAPVDSPEYDLYDQGIRFGCWGMAIYALSCAFFSMIIEKLIKKFTAKKVFVGSMLNFSVAMALLGYFPTKLGVLLFSTTAGVVYATLFTIPFLLVAQYHGKGTFKVKKPENNNVPEKSDEPVVEFERGLGTDCGIVGSMMFVAQFTMSLSIGSLITMVHSVAAVLYAASFFSFLAAISGCFVVYMDL